MRTDGNNANLGTTDSSGGAWATLDYAGSHVAAGDTVMVRAAAGNASSYPTSSLDYSTSGFFTPVDGSLAAGYVKWIGYNGVPTIGSNGLLFYQCSYQHFEGLYFVATSNSNGNNGLLNLATGCVVKSCTVNTNNQTGEVGITANGSTEVINCEVYGGTASPSNSAGCYGISAGSYGALVQGCRIRNCRDHGIYTATASGGVQILNNLIYGNAGDGVYAVPADTVPVRVIGNTINANLGHGVNVDSTNGAAWAVIRNNNITNQAQASKYGINVTTASSDPRKRLWGWNNVWNNTGHYNNVTADATDLSVDPGYADAANGDFTPSATSLRGAAVPITFPGG